MEKFNGDTILDLDPYSLGREDKQRLFTRELGRLTGHHYEHCLPYRQILDFQGLIPSEFDTPASFPFLPVRLFKDFELLSVDRKEVFKTMTSSGTSGASVSKIYLNRENATLQIKVLAKILSSFLGTKRLPMLVIDSPSVLKDRQKFSARGAGIIGFSMLGKDITYALDEEMNLNVDALRQFEEKYKDQDVFVFGFTFMIWKYFVGALESKKMKLDLNKGIAIHGGGWKKLTDQAVSPDEFKARMGKVSGISKVHSYYGMVEQTGSIFMECEKGYLHSSVFSDVIMRRPDFSVSDVEEEGLVQLVSLLPSSYPGHSLLSEDVGRIVGEDDCACGRLGKYFEIQGRVAEAEIRGCSDTYNG